ncbi:MAG: bacillithiol biosynthesis deacetylase BshB1 [Cytophagales bacterium]|nr:bacillithiol biosynthesis deacetylase BshB1 [Cytophagales bacterium]
MIDVLAIGAHPDDVELGAGGTLVVQKALGQTIGILDLTRGEMGTRGTAEIRDQEATEAGRILDLDVRDNMEFKDVFFKEDEEHKMKLVQKIRLYRPKIVLTNAEEDRHPDHGRAAKLVEEACFWAGLKRIETVDDSGNAQEPHRPTHVYHFIQSRSNTPDFYVDISDVHEQKIEAYKAYKSQFFDPTSVEPETYVSSQNFISMVESRAREYGQRIGVQYAEGFTTRGFLGVRELGGLV